MYAPTAMRSAHAAAAGVARVRVGYGAACVHSNQHAAKRNVLQGSWSIPSFMTTAHKPGPRPLVTTS